MGLLIKPEDFTGKNGIPQNTFSEISAWIDKYEEPYLAKLLGAELFKLFKADITVYLPSTPIYQALFNPFKEDDGSLLRISEGMKEMVLGFVFFEYMRNDGKFKNTISGPQVNTGETSREVGYSEFNIWGRYNDSARTFQEIQWYIEKNSSDYPDYNGQEIGLVHWS
jgi:hypothetical protein